MVALVRTVAYLGLKARAVEVQCQVAAGLPRFAIVGLPDKAVGESRERVQAALAAMNPCRCGHLADPALACSRAPRCAADYQGKVSGPLLDRIDLHVEVDPVRAADLALPPPTEGSAEVAARVDDDFALSGSVINMRHRRRSGRSHFTTLTAAFDSV